MRGRKPGLAAINKRLAPTHDAPISPCPDWLDDMAKEEWHRVVGECERLGHATLVDMVSLACYCRAYSQWVKCELLVEREGMILTGCAGQLILHPAARHASKLMQEVRKAAQEFGFSPATRAKVGTATKPHEEISDFDEFNRNAG